MKQIKRIIVVWATVQYAAHVDGATIHVTGPDERQIEFGDGTASFATLSGGEGYINSTVTVNAPDFVVAGTSVNDMMALIREHQTATVAQQAEIEALKQFVGMMPPLAPPPVSPAPVSCADDPNCFGTDWTPLNAYQALAYMDIKPQFHVELEYLQSATVDGYHECFFNVGNDQRYPSIYTAGNGWHVGLGHSDIPDAFAPLRQAENIGSTYKMMMTMSRNEGSTQQEAGDLYTLTVVMAKDGVETVRSSNNQTTVSHALIGTNAPIYAGRGRDCCRSDDLPGGSYRNLRVYYYD